MSKKSTNGALNPRPSLRSSSDNNSTLFIWNTILFLFVCSAKPKLDLANPGLALFDYSPIWCHLTMGLEAMLEPMVASINRSKWQHSKIAPLWHECQVQAIENTLQNLGCIHINSSSTFFPKSSPWKACIFFCTPVLVTCAILYAIYCHH